MISEEHPQSTCVCRSDIQKLAGRCSTEPSRESVPIGMVSTSSITCLHNKIARMILERAEREREASKLHMVLMQKNGIS